MKSFSMQFCSKCGAKVTLRIPADDTRERHVCDQCNTVHYINPRNVVGTIPVWGEQVLLCRRAIQPRHGFWTLPAGFMEIGETTMHGAARETLEEAGAAVDVGPLFSLINVPHVEQVHFFYLATLPSPVFSAGEESLEVALFYEHEIPWSELAFPTTKQTLEWFFMDRKAGRLNADSGFAVHTRAILPSEAI